jgi:hypothetical protein
LGVAAGPAWAVTTSDIDRTAAIADVTITCDFFIASLLRVLHRMACATELRYLSTYTQCMDSRHLTMPMYNPFGLLSWHDTVPQVPAIVGTTTKPAEAHSGRKGKRER